MRKLSALRHNERGAVSIIMAMAMFVVIGFVAFAVDMGYLRAKKADLQKAADIAALAGGRALVSFGSDLPKIKAKVTEFGQSNLHSSDSPATALQDSDITFYLDGAPNTTSPNQIEVSVTRSTARGNALPTIFGAALGVDEFDVSASARSSAVAMCSSKCLKPFSVPDKFTYTEIDGDGELTTTNPQEMSTVVVEGYSEADLGSPITLKIGVPSDTIVPGQFNAINFPPVNKDSPISGAAAYRENIIGCTGSNNAMAVGINDELQLEPGNMTGPTAQGISDFLAQDSGAYWDATTQSIKGSSYADPLNSPRIAMIAFYDPSRPPVSGRNSIFVNFIGAVFIEGITGKSVTGRFVRAIAVDPDSGSEGNCLSYSFKFVRDSSR